MPDGALVPLAEQDRSLWNGAAIKECVALITESLATKQLGPYQLHAAVAAVHAEAPSAEDTDWAEILGLYELLAHRSPNPVVTLNHAVAVAMVRGPQAGLHMLGELDSEERLAGYHHLPAVRAHLLEMVGDLAADPRLVPTGRAPHDQHPGAAKHPSNE